MVLFLLLFLIAGASASSTAVTQSLASSSMVVTVSIIGAIDLNSTTFKLQNMTLWGEYPVSLSDTVYYSVTAFLNDVLSGTTPPDRRSTNTSDAAKDAADEPMAWYWILLITLGGVVAVVAIVLAIYFGVVANQARANDTPPLLPPPPMPSDGIHQARSLGFPSMSYPPPHAYSKVIQIPLARPRAPSPIQHGGGV